jgi:two-component system, chemotaxis family, chemotaxis protein CheY
MPAAADLSTCNTDQPRRVLVVDDDDVIRDAVAEALELEGYSVGRARDGEEALGYLRSNAPHAIVLDLMMPGMDGWTFVERCREEALCAGIPIVVVSASHNLRTAARELRPRGVSAVIAKPFELDVLIGAVERLVRPCTT